MQIKMKRIILPTILLALVILVIRLNSGTGSMTLRPSQLSPETEGVLDIVGDEVMFFDYAVNETIKSKKIDIWIYEDGEWRILGNSSGNLESLEGQAAVEIGESSCAVFDIDSTGHTKISFPFPEGFGDWKSWTECRITDPVDFEAEEEIALWTRLGYGESGEKAVSTLDFRGASCSQGIAVTAKFSEEAAEK